MGFSVTVIATLISGFIHFDFVTKQRQTNVFPAAINIVFPQILATALVILALHYCPDYRAMLLVILAIPVFSLLISHITATRRYQLGFDRSILLKMLKFAWPLMISSLLIFTVFQGDKVIIGGYYDMATLGLYSVVFSSLLLPTMRLHRLYNAMVLALIARSFHSRDNFQTHSSMIISSTIVLCAITSGIFLILGPSLLILVSIGNHTGDGRAPVRVVRKPCAYDRGPPVTAGRTSGLAHMLHRDNGVFWRDLCVDFSLLTAENTFLPTLTMGRYASSIVASGAFFERGIFLFANVIYRRRIDGSRGRRSFSRFHFNHTVFGRLSLRTHPT